MYLKISYTQTQHSVIVTLRTLFQNKSTQWHLWCTAALHPLGAQHGQSINLLLAPCVCMHVCKLVASLQKALLSTLS